MYYVEMGRDQLNGHSLSIDDWTSSLELEKRLHRIDHPVYLVNYCTSDGRVPGHLVFGSAGVSFVSMVPDNVLVYGHVDDECDRIPMLSISYDDVCDDGVVETVIPDGMYDIDYYLQIGLYNIGMK